MTDTTSSDRARAASGMSPPTQPGRELSTLDRKIIERRTAIEGMEQQFQLAMPKGLEAQQLVRDAVTALRSVPELVNATQESFLGALMTAAQLGLRPNVPALGHGWVLPFRNNKRNIVEAQWILGYQGMIELAQRTGMIASIVAHTIYEHEKYEVEWGLNERLVHTPIFDEEARGAPILHYAVARFTHTDVPAWHIMGEDEIERIRVRSKSATSQHSPWNTDRPAMARKSAVIRLFKFLPKTTLLAQAIAADESVRVDLTPEAIDTGETTSTATVPHARAADPNVVDAAVVPDEGIQDEPPPAPPADATVPERRPLGSSALRRGLMTAVKDKHGGDVFTVLANVTGGYPFADDVTIDDALAMLSNDELKAAMGIGDKQPEGDA